MPPENPKPNTSPATARTAEERARLVETRVSADGNPDYATNPGRDTQYRVWLLSIPEVEKYFKDDEARICYPTRSSVNNGVHESSNDACWWWLRSPGAFGINAAIVLRSGCIGSYGIDVCGNNVAVRPVVSLRLS